ncbi:hypothetical protein ACOME3_009446 [Neoechinorhynchus agilis]
MEKQMSFWLEQEPTIYGMLQGMVDVNEPDLRGSKEFIEDLVKEGILIKDTEKFLEQARLNISNTFGPGAIGRLINLPIQAFKCEHDRYDLAWIQWVSGYIADTDFAYLLKNQIGTKIPLIVIKDNVSRSNHDWVDESDGGITRSLDSYKRIFAEAGFEVAKETIQEGLDPSVEEVRMFALRKRSID